MNENDICFEKYVYLDWNIVKNMISPRKGSFELDEELKRTIINLKKSINSHIVMLILKIERIIIEKNIMKL